MDFVTERDDKGNPTHREAVWAPAVTNIARGERTGMKVAIITPGRVVVVDENEDEIRKLHRREIRAAALLDKDDRSNNPRPLPTVGPEDVT